MKRLMTFLALGVLLVGVKCFAQDMVYTKCSLVSKDDNLITEYAQKSLFQSLAMTLKFMKTLSHSRMNFYT